MPFDLFNPPVVVNWGILDYLAFLQFLNFYSKWGRALLYFVRSKWLNLLRTLWRMLRTSYITICDTQRSLTEFDWLRRLLMMNVVLAHVSRVRTSKCDARTFSWDAPSSLYYIDTLTLLLPWVWVDISSVSWTTIVRSFNVSFVTRIIYRVSSCIILFPQKTHWGILRSYP